LPGRLFKGPLQVAPTGDAEALLLPENAQPATEGIFTQQVAQHHEEHRRLAVADRRRCAMRSRSERGQRLPASHGHGGEVAQPAEPQRTRGGG
jgi:hypothetical protein